MDRAIVGFHRDEAAHWVAELACGHGQHVRHDPPYKHRPWVETEPGRAAHLGRSLDCVRCDRRELPEGHAAYRRTATFDAATTPVALQSRHTTKPGVWGLIHVESGRLGYRIHAPYDVHETLTPGAPGVVMPEVEHEVEITGPVEFHVEFWK